MGDEELERRGWRMLNWAENESDPSMWPVVLTDEEAARHGRELLARALANTPKIAQRQGEEPRA